MAGLFGPALTVCLFVLQASQGPSAAELSAGPVEEKSVVRDLNTPREFPSIESREVWQARAGAVHVTTTDSPGADDGVMLHENTAIQISAGRVVRYRKVGPGIATIVREAV